MKLILLTVFITNATITSYRSVPEQTDESPFYTSIGEHVHPHGVAVSRDLLKRWGGPLDYGDWIYVEGFGIKVINDCMNERHKNRVDIWVKTYAEEKEVGIRTGRIWIIKVDKVDTKEQISERLFQAETAEGGANGRH